MEIPIDNLAIGGDEEDELQLGPVGNKQQIEFVDFRLVGKVLTDKTVNFNVVKNRMASVWRPCKGMNMKEVDPNLYVFQFFNLVDLKRAMDGGPWTYDNNLLLFHKLMPGEVARGVTLCYVDIWIRIYDLPARYMSVNIGKQLGYYIGCFVEYDSSNNSTFWKNYMRVRVGIDVRVPLKRGKKIACQGKHGMRINFKYERLSNFCFVCGLLGHTEFLYNVVVENPGKEIKREWGTWLRAQNRKSSNFGGERWLREESDGPDGGASSSNDSQWR